MLEVKPLPTLHRMNIRQHRDLTNSRQISNYFVARADNLISLTLAMAANVGTSGPDVAPFRLRCLNDLDASLASPHSASSFLEDRLRQAHMDAMVRLVDQLRDRNIAGDAYELIGLMLREMFVDDKKIDHLLNRGSRGVC